MSTFSRNEIQRRALKGNSIGFLRSEAIAKAVAARFRHHLGKQMPPGTVHVGESARHPGTWLVGMYIMRHAPISYVNNQLNHSESQRVAAAFKAVFRPEDLVTSWTRPPRQH